MKRPSRAGYEKGAIGQLMAETVSLFFDTGIESPHITAETLLAHVLNLTKSQLYLSYDRKLSDAEIECFKTLVSRRLNREPLAYILGEKGFWSLSLTVTPDVLIPRPDTESLVEAALKVIAGKERSGEYLRILDLGTGSGAIILSLATERPDHRFFANDLSYAALRIARENEKHNHLDQKIHFFCGAWFDAIKPGVVFDLIVSNPPYIRRGDIETLDPEICRFEPFLALDGDNDGLFALRHIINEAGSYLKPGGTLMIEIGDGQEKDLVEIIKKTKRYAPPLVYPDLTGKIRVVRMDTPLLDIEKRE